MKISVIPPVVQIAGNSMKSQVNGAVIRGTVVPRAGKSASPSRRSSQMNKTEQRIDLRHMEVMERTLLFADRKLTSFSRKQGKFGSKVTWHKMDSDSSPTDPRGVCGISVLTTELPKVNVKVLTLCKVCAPSITEDDIEKANGILS